MRYALHDCTVSFRDRVVLDHIDFEIKGKEKIAVVGRNGSGKTTLLRLLKGELEPDRDDRRKLPPVEKSRALTVEMLEQARDVEAAEELSGGEQTRRLLGELIEKHPDILLLDEPTNHLDMESVERLERTVRDYDGAVVLVSHDRFFMDRVAGAVCELEGGRLTRWTGSYTHYREEKKRLLESAARRQKNRQREIARLTAVIEKFKKRPRKAAMARAKRTQLERLKQEPVPRLHARQFHFEALVPEHPGPKEVWAAEKLLVGYGRKPLYELTLKIKRGQKLGILGPNGSGKSALLKTAAGVIPQAGGRQQTGEGVTVGYFDQLTARTDSPLSGGEQAKAALQAIIGARPNFLILDEPTNHMDVDAQEAVEELLRDYPGTILFTTHDRYFLSRVADSLLILEKGGPKYYPFGYEHYLYHKELQEFGGSPARKFEAQEQALIADLKAVPAPEKGRTKTAPAEVVWQDRRLALAWEECERRREAWEHAPDEETMEAAEKAWTESLVAWDLVRREGEEGQRSL